MHDANIESIVYVTSDRNNEEDFLVAQHPPHRIIRIDSRIDYTSTLARSIQQTMRGFYNNKQNNHVAIAVTVAAILVFMTPSPPQRHYTMVQSFTVPTTTTITTSRTSKTTRVNAIQMESKWSMMPDEPAPEVRSK